VTHPLFGLVVLIDIGCVNEFTPETVKGVHNLEGILFAAFAYGTFPSLAEVYGTQT
jgi:hypothetical protein